MIDVQSQSAEMSMMTGIPGLDEECHRLTKRTSDTGSAKPGLKNLWLRRRAEYTALSRSGRATVIEQYTEFGEQ